MSILPERPSLEQLRKQAKNLLRSAKAGDEQARARLAAVVPGVGRRWFPSSPKLSDAQLVIARESGFESWPTLVRHVESIAGGRTLALQPLIRPIELGAGRSWQLSDGSSVPTDDVYAMFAAARDGGLHEVKRLVQRAPALATVEYNYTPPIHFAVREGHRDITAFLIDHGADAGAYRSYPFGEALLTYAEERGHADVADLLRTTLSRRFRVSSGTQAILEAAREGNIDRVRAELAREPRLASAGNETGDTALHRAATGGHLHVVQALVDAGAPVDAVRGDGYRPVQCALMPNWFMPMPSRTRDAIADLLLERGACYTIFLAALRGDAAYVTRELRRDRSLANFEDTCHHRVLSAAVRRGDVVMTRMLLEYGADPNLPEEGAPRGASLLIAIADRRREIVRMLLQRGADPNADVDSSGTPMSRAEGDPELRELLAAYGGSVPKWADSLEKHVGGLLLAGRLKEADALLRENPGLIHDDEAGWGDGVLAGPAHGQRHDVIELLMRHGARVPKVTKWAPEYYFKHYGTAKFLLEHGMDPGGMNWHRLTLLHHFAMKGDADKVKLLLEHGADIDAIDDEYRSTPLGLAARLGQRSIVELLLAHGADPEAGGAEWAKPRVWAERRGHAAIAALIAGHCPHETGRHAGQA